MTTIVIYQVDPKLLLPILSILVKQHTTPVCRVPPADPPFFLECEPLAHPVVMVTKACTGAVCSIWAAVWICVLM